MSIASTVSRNDYIGNGATATYNYNFKIFAATDLEVAVRDTSDVVTIYTLNVDYTVTGVGEDAGGTIILTAGNLANNYALAIRRAPPLTQLTDIKNQGDFFPEVHENTFDKGTMVDQKQQDEIDRSIKLNVTTDPATFDTSIPGDVTDPANAGKCFAVNDDNDGIMFGPSISQINAVLPNANAAAASAAAALVSENNAAASEAAAAASEANAAASEAAALNAALGLQWVNVVFKTFADSPITVTPADRATYYVIDTTGGNVSVQLPQISTLDLNSAPFMLGFKKSDNSANLLIINRGGTDVIDEGLTTRQFSQEQYGARFFAESSVASWQTELSGLNEAAYITADFRANGPFSSGADVDGRHYIPFDIEILNVAAYIRDCGSAGTTTLDLAYKTTPGGSWNSVFSTKPSFANTAANDNYIDSLGTTALGAGVIRPILSTTVIPGGSVIGIDINSAATGALDCGITVHYRRL